MTGPDSAKQVVPDPLPENLRSAYGEVCASHREVGGFREKLLGLLPVASGTGIYMLLPKGGEPVHATPPILVGVGLFGALVSFGLFLHEIRGIKRCGELIKVGRTFEELMRLPTGEFIKADAYYHGKDRSAWNNFVGPIGAGRIIYLSVILAWLVVAGIGVHAWCVIE